jgi:hypothetical protein
MRRCGHIHKAEIHEINGILWPMMAIVESQPPG